MGSVTLDRSGFLIDGKRQVLLVGSLFYFRIPRAAWRDRMEKMKLAGYSTLDVYFPWNYHELKQDEWDFTGERDVDAFLRLAEETGLYVVARPGPYICSEWDGGGLPAYLFASGMRIRDNDPAYLNQVKKWFDRILPVIKPHLYTNGGCIIAMQLENELDFFSDTKDRHGYIDALKRMAEGACIDVPFLCCSGQSGLQASGGLHKGINPAMNFYPKPEDRPFGDKALFYQKWLYKQGYPLLVTETNRDHQFLRLLLLLGAKLLGPYNQAGGTDFSFTNAVNNWGKPLSFQTSDYDFESMVSPSGEYKRNMALEARILSGIISAIPGLAQAQPAPLPEGFMPSDSVFATALALPGGGLVLGGMQYGTDTEYVSWPENGCPIAFEPGRCVMLMSHVSLSALELNCEITFSSAVPVKIDRESIVFAAEQTESTIVLNGKVLQLQTGEVKVADGISVSLFDIETAAALPKQEAPSAPVTLSLQTKLLSEESLGAGLKSIPVKNGSLALEANGVLRGIGIYESEIDAGKAKGILLTDAADVITASLGKRSLGAHCPAGHPLYLPLNGFSGIQPLYVRGEIWGHSNFDDHRAPSMRIKSTRGIKSIVLVTEATALPLWMRTDDLAGTAPHYTEFGSWQTTEMPVRGTFRKQIQASGSVRFMHFNGLQAQADVSVNDCPAGRADRYHPWVDLSRIPDENGMLHIECQILKMDFDEPCGIPVLYQGEPAGEVTLKAMGEEELYHALKLNGTNGEPLTFPLTFGDGQITELYGIIREFDCELTLSGHDIKATIIRGGHICGRMILDSGSFPFMAGGRPDTAYLPACWGDDLYICLEALSKNAVLHSVTARTIGTYSP